MSAANTRSRDSFTALSPNPINENRGNPFCVCTSIVTGKEKKPLKAWIKRYLSEAEIVHIGQSVTRAESQTSGEIVPVILKKSSATGHVSTIIFLFAALVFLGTDLSFHGEVRSEIVWTIISIGLIIAWFGSHWLAKFHCWQRWLTPMAEQKSQVWQRAELEFYRNRLTSTTNRTGILIFVSVMERKAVVLADEGISQHHPVSIWQDLVSELSLHLKRDEWAEGFEKAITTAGKILSEKLPAQRHERNELANNLRILE